MDTIDKTIDLDQAIAAAVAADREAAELARLNKEAEARRQDDEAKTTFKTKVEEALTPELVKALGMYLEKRPGSTYGYGARWHYRKISWSLWVEPNYRIQAWCLIGESPDKKACYSHMHDATNKLAEPLLVAMGDTAARYEERLRKDEEEQAERDKQEDLRLAARKREEEAQQTRYAEMLAEHDRCVALIEVAKALYRENAWQWPRVTITLYQVTWSTAAVLDRDADRFYADKNTAWSTVDHLDASGWISLYNEFGAQMETKLSPEFNRPVWMRYTAAMTSDLPEALLEDDSLTIPGFDAMDGGGGDPDPIFVGLASSFVRVPINDARPVRWVRLLVDELAERSSIAEPV